ncbi:MAG: SpoIIE family protein phosphatase, partial [Oscillospiraceae bacterium]|nr:SpoIIE family protein phosphatase [Oscillospiraceae bacterium]
YEVQLEKGSILVLYTDGVAEATNAENELFGTDRLLDALNSAENDTPENVLERVSKAVDGFVKEAPQFDDLTMLCIRYIGK